MVIKFCIQCFVVKCYNKGSGYGYGTVLGGRWTIYTEGGHVVVSVSLIQNGYEYGTVPDRRGTIRTESGHVVNSVSRIRSGYESRRAAVKCPNFTSGRSGHSKGSCALLCCLLQSYLFMVEHSIT